MENNLSSSRVIRFGSFELDQTTGELYKSGDRVRLQDQPFRVLSELVKRPGELITREELREKLWPGDTYVDFEQNLNAVIKRVRRALDDSAEVPRFVETLPKRGYRFIFPVEGGGAGAESPAKPPAGEAGSLAASVFRSRHVVAAGIGIAVLLAIAIAVGLSVRGRPSEPSISVSEPISIAVLPLGNLAVAPGQDYFADGITDALITDLGSIARIKVISRTSVLQYKGTKKTLPEIARELNVSHLVEGSVQRAGDEVRISVRLIDAPNDRQLWSRNYRREMRDVLNLQSEVAQAVAVQVRASLNPLTETRLTKRREVNPEAHEAYLRGRAAQTPSEAMPYFEQAIERDPQHAGAYTKLAQGHMLLALGWSGGAPPRVSVLAAKRAVGKALEIDNTFVDAHTELAIIRHLFDWDWAGAERSYQRALQLNPSDSFAHIEYAAFLSNFGRHGEAAAEVARAIETDPSNAHRRWMASHVYMRARDYDQGLQYARIARDMAPKSSAAHLFLGRALLAKGMYEEAIDAFHEALRLAGGHSVGAKALLARAYAEAQKPTQALRILRELEESSKKTPLGILAIAHIGLGHEQRALDLLERAYEIGDPALVGLKSSFIWDPLRSHPRFQKLLKKMNFPE